MRTDDKRKQTSRRKWKPTNPIEDTFVFEMASTLWRLHRQAPAESAMISIQTQTMAHQINKEFATDSPSATYALAVVAPQEHGDALNQNSRQGRRLLSQYEKLKQQLITMRQLCPPVAPVAPNFEPQNESAETKLIEEHQATRNQCTESESLETKPVETKLMDSVTLQLPFPRETPVHKSNTILLCRAPTHLEFRQTCSKHKGRTPQKPTKQGADKRSAQPFCGRT